MAEKNLNAPTNKEVGSGLSLDPLSDNISDTKALIDLALTPNPGITTGDLFPGQPRSVTGYGYQGKTFSAPTVAPIVADLPFGALAKYRQARLDAKKALAFGTETSPGGGQLDFSETPLANALKSNEFNQARLARTQEWYEWGKKKSIEEYGTPLHAAHFVRNSPRYRSEQLLQNNFANLYNEVYKKALMIKADPLGTYYDKKTFDMLDKVIFGVDGMVTDPSSMEQYAELLEQFEGRTSTMDLINKTIKPLFYDLSESLNLSDKLKRTSAEDVYKTVITKGGIFEDGMDYDTWVRDKYKILHPNPDAPNVIPFKEFKGMINNTLREVIKEGKLEVSKHKQATYKEPEKPEFTTSLDKVQVNYYSSDNPPLIPKGWMKQKGTYDGIVIEGDLEFSGSVNKMWNPTDGKFENPTGVIHGNIVNVFYNEDAKETWAMVRDAEYPTVSGTFKTGAAETRWIDWGSIPKSTRKKLPVVSINDLRDLNPGALDKVLKEAYKKAGYLVIE